MSRDLSASPESAAVVPVSRAMSREEVVVSAVSKGLTAITLCCGVAVVGLSAHPLSVYEQTSLPAEYLLPLWPVDLDLRPTVALTVSGCIVFVAAALSLVAEQMASRRPRRVTLFALVSLAASLIALIAVTSAVSIFYAVNSSSTMETLLSWSCHWRFVVMTLPPHFGLLCHESYAALSITVLILPVEALLSGAAAWRLFRLRREARSVAPPARDTGEGDTKAERE